MKEKGFCENRVNVYSYDVQLYSMRKDQSVTYHILYDEHLHFLDVLYRPTSPINFDFIRDKSSSKYQSIDHSYSDLFDFRIQLQQIQILSADDPNVRDVLHGVDIDQVLYMDKNDCNLYISSPLRQFVKYIRCTRSNRYLNEDDQITINIGSYEEYRLNGHGICQLIMKSENTMTIELLNMKNVPSAEKLYHLGMWFSSLCQTCVDLPSSHIDQKSSYRHQWFSNILHRKKKNQTLKRVHVDQLTQYTGSKLNQVYNSEQLALVTRILHEDHLEKIFSNLNNNQLNNQNLLKKEFQKLKKQLEYSAVPSADQALNKLQQAYHTINHNLNQI